MTKLLIDAGNLLPFYLGVFALLLAGCSSTGEAKGSVVACQYSNA